MRRDFFSWRRALGNDCACYVFLLFLCVLAYLPAIVAVLRGGVPFRGDGVSLFWPWRTFARHSLQTGILPLWNPYSQCGMPFLSNLQTSVLYPPNVVYWILPYRFAALLDLMAHDTFLMAGAYCFARSLRLDNAFLSRHSALLAAIALGLGGGVASHSYAGHTTWHAARAFLPWELWATLLFLRGGKARHAILLALLFVLQLASGYPPMAIGGLGLCSGLFLARSVSLFHASRHSSTRNRSLPVRCGWPDRFWSKTCGAMFLCATLSAVYLLPMLETSRLSVHGTGMPFEMVTFLSGRWPMFWRLVMPRFFGSDYTGWSAARGAHEENGFNGVLALSLALVAPWVVRRPVARWLWTLLPLCFVLCLGDGTPLYQWLFDHCVLFRQLRLPARWIEGWSLAVPFLAALVFETVFVRQPDPHQSRIFKLLHSWLNAVFAFLVVATMLTALLPASWWKMQLQAALPSEALPPQELLWPSVIDNYRATALIACVLALLVMGIACWLLLHFGPTKARDTTEHNATTVRRLQTLRIGLLGVAALDVLLLFWQSAETVSAPQFALQTRWGAGLEKRYVAGERWHTSVIVAASNVNLVTRIDNFDGYDALMSKRYFLFLSRLKPVPRWDAWLQVAGTASPLLRAAAVTHFLSSEQPPILAPDADLVAQQNNWKLWHYPRAWPRFYLSRHVLPIPENNQLDRLTNLAAHDFQAQQQPCIVAPDAVLSVAPSPLTNRDRVLDWQRSGNLVMVETQAQTPSVLVQSEALAPGWRAWVNGRETPVYSANYLFRGVQVPAGKARVALIYDSQTYRFALFVSLCGLAFVASFAAASRRTRNRC